MSFKEMTWNQIAKEVHQNAVDHGWWDGGNRPYKEILQLVSTEIAEASEAVRIGAPPVYVDDMDYDGISRYITPQDTDWETYKHFKTEGEAIELADAVIRLLDWAGRHEFQLDDEIPVYPVSPKESGLEFHFDLNRVVFEKNCTNEGKVHLFIKHTLTYFVDKGWDLKEIIELKHNYNKLRPYRHGGKLA